MAGILKNTTPTWAAVSIVASAILLIGLRSLFMSPAIEMPDNDSNIPRDQSAERLPQHVVPAAERRWPSATETSVLWNTCREIVLEVAEENRLAAEEITGQKTRPARFQFASSVPEPIEEVFETRDVIASGMDLTREYLEAHGFASVNEICETVFDEDFFFYLGKSDPSEYSKDRTLSTFVVEPDLFSPDFVRMIQQKFLSNWPLWRVFVIARVKEGEENLLIYPDRIFIGDSQFDPASMEGPIQKWNTAIRANRDRKEAPQRRQFRVVRRQLPNAIKELAKQPIKFLAAFDSVYGEFDRHSIWVLSRRGKSFLPVAPEYRSHCHAYLYVTDSGLIVPSSNPAGKYHLEEWAVHNGETDNVILKDEDTAELWKPQTTDWPLMTDVELKHLEANGELPRVAPQTPGT